MVGTLYQHYICCLCFFVFFHILQLILFVCTAGILFDEIKVHIYNQFSRFFHWLYVEYITINLSRVKRIRRIVYDRIETTGHVSYIDSCVFQFRVSSMIERSQLCWETHNQTFNVKCLNCFLRTFLIWVDTTSDVKMLVNFEHLLQCTSLQRITNSHFL